MDDFVTSASGDYGWNPLEHGYSPLGEVDTPDDCCPDCTKDLDERGWCFECRDYPRGEKEPA